MEIITLRSANRIRLRILAKVYVSVIGRWLAIERIYVFGSYANNDQNPRDIDLIVQHSSPCVTKALNFTKYLIGFLGVDVHFINSSGPKSILYRNGQSRTCIPLTMLQLELLV